MPFQRSSLDTINKPRRPNKIVACADVPFEVGPGSKREPWLSQRFGFIGSKEGFDLFRYEAPTIALTPANASSIIESRLIDALVIEHAHDDLCEAWGSSFFDWSSAPAIAHEMVQLAARCGIPRTALLLAGIAQVPLFVPLARALDYVVVTDAAAQVALAGHSISAFVVGPVMQPAKYNAFAPFTDEGAARIKAFSLDLARAVEDQAAADTLASLTPFGISLFEPDLLVTAERVKALGDLAEFTQGSVTEGQLRHVLKTHDILVQISRLDRDPRRDVQLALQAAASRCAVAILGQVAADDPRRAFAHIFADIAELRGFLSRMMLDHVWAEKTMQAGWREVHRHNTAAPLVSLIAGAGGTPVPPPRRPRATVVAPTLRPQLLKRLLATYRSQLWEAKELVVVANTDRPDEWPVDLLDAKSGEIIVFLPRQYGAGVALNLGAAHATGDYVMRMDDDDYYGPHYVEDMMLAADALWPDILGKSATYYNYVDEEKLVWRPSNNFRPSSYTSHEIRTTLGHIAGFSHVVRREIFDRIEYPRSVHAAADIGFLEEAELLGELLCARADNLNAVVQRRSDVSTHTWRAAPALNDKLNVDVSMNLADLLA